MSTRTLPAVPRPTLTSVTRLNSQLRRQLAALRHDHAELLVAARAAVIAHFDGAALPLTVLIDTLDQLNALPEYAPQITHDGLAALAPAADPGPPLVGRRVA
ncbi:hypothetical protein A8W25_30035 [Streptomyces sp. ERV7]|uniref:hypothetical protein n=1 Tax=Streptomyces sp. ERV7 TaxID=1322334 RepID=UPI0007F50783|nr:hypothetical protein [Streptomyces sp. ERV7]OAR22047.1 hypothetical protein A8W25_30035 [Streptomyces sp. ERV7]